MTQYYTEFQLYLNEGEDLTDAQKPRVKQALYAASQEMLPVWQQQLNQVTDIALNLADDGVLIQMLITTDGELSDDTYGTSMELINDTMGFDFYAGDDDEYNDFITLKQIHRAIDDDFSIQWTDDINYVDADDTDSITYDLADPEKQWVEANVQ